MFSYPILSVIFREIVCLYVILNISMIRKWSIFERNEHKTTNETQSVYMYIHLKTSNLK